MISFENLHWTKYPFIIRLLAFLCLTSSCHAVTIEEINSKYYNYYDSKINKVSYRLILKETRDQFQNIIDIFRSKGNKKVCDELTNYAINVTWEKDKQPIITTTELSLINDSLYDAGISQVISGNKKIALGSLNSWLELIEYPIIYDSSVKDSEIFTKKDSVIVERRNSTISRRNVFYNEYKNVITFFNIEESKQTIIITKNYLSINNKLMPLFFIYEDVKNRISHKVVYEYLNDKDDNILPSTILTQIKMPSIEMKMTMFLKDIIKY